MKKFYILLIAIFGLTIAHAQWIPQNSGTTTHLFSVDFTDSNTGYIGGWDNLLLKTLDGGTTWDTLNTPVGSGYFFSVTFTDVNTGFAAGNGILKTADAGLTLAYNQTCCNGSLSSVFFVDTNIGYTVGLEDSPYNHYWIHKTIDGGTTWFTASEGEGEQFYSIFFTDANTGYAVGTSIIKTTDGGTTWDTVLNIQQPGQLNSVFFSDTNTGYAVGYSGTIIKTIDAGLTWNVQSSGTTDGLLSIYFPTVDTGYIVGDKGTILKTTNGGGFPVEVNEIPSTSNSLKIYPNPASDKIIIESTTVGGQLSILNLNGKELLKQTSTEPNTTINITTLPGGIYIVKIRGKRSFEVGKIIKM